ncbi:MAG TPA: DUF2336 domain-containing protein [Xanthobacteraceae bacterium]|nr:DUF2336 domain-containing protein [Xanthobacteraceae bacterium]
MTNSAYSSLISDLEHAISHGSAQHRAETLMHVTDLFITGSGKYSDDQIEIFDDVIGRLAAAIEAKARVKLATRLASLAQAPSKVLRSLAFDDNPEVAAPVLAGSAVLDDETLIESASKKSQQHLLAISERASLSEAVTDVLVERGDRQVIHSVTRNRGARFSDAGFGKLVKRSEGDDMLAEHVGLRADLPRHHLLRLIANATDTVRKKLEGANPQAAEDVKQVVTEVVGKIRAESVSASRNYMAAKQAIEPLLHSKKFGENELYALAKAKRFEETVIALAFLSSVPIEAVETAMLDESADMMLILIKAARMSWTTAKAILLLRAADRGVSAHDLEQALIGFERLNVETAQRVVKFYKTRLTATAVPA